MLTNEGTSDRVFRILAGVVLGYLAWSAWPAPLAIVAVAVAGILLITGALGWCALYALFGFSTRKQIGVAA